MRRFTMNGYSWRVCFVNPDDPMLVDRTGVLRVATTDPQSLCVYISNKLTGDFLTRVTIHELGHCAIYSFGLADDIRRMTYPAYWIEAEEWVCNFIADYALSIFEAGHCILDQIPCEIERLIA